MTSPPPGAGNSGGGDTSGDLILGDRYRVGPMIGRGGMADVRSGHDSRLGRTVAIKRLRNDLASDPTFQARFRREAQSAASLNHPAIVAVYDTGDEVDADGSHVPYIVMEFVEGETLRDLVREGRKILPERALEITADVLSALDYSHRAGIVHRDIKPANVMLTPAGQVKVMDFGIARAIADSSSTMTATAAVVGTAQYLSPEQARGEQVDARSDIYSTGCMLFELLTGRPPFLGDSPVSVAYQHVREEPVLASSIEAEVSPDIDAIVSKALAKRTSERYQSAAQMRADIERALAGQAVEAPVVAVSAGDDLSGATALATTSMFAGPDEEPQEQTRRRRPWIWLLLGLLLVGLLGGVGYVLVQGAGNDSVLVPDVVGMKVGSATTELRDAGLEVSTDEQASEEPAGRVTSQEPADGSAARGSAVELVVSAGPDAVNVPTGLVGASQPAAVETLRRAGLEADTERAASTEPRNQVIDASPESGTAVEPGSTVTLVLSTGPAQVPNVVGQRQSVAENVIERAGLTPYVTFDSNASANAGRVVQQSPDAGTSAGSGDQVTITVSSRPDETQAPPPEPTSEPTTTEPTTSEPTTSEPTTSEPTTSEPTTTKPTTTKPTTTKPTTTKPTTTKPTTTKPTTTKPTTTKPTTTKPTTTKPTTTKPTDPPTTPNPPVPKPTDPPGAGP